MDTKQRSSLRKSLFLRGDNDIETPRFKRSISFSGRKLVREFHHEKEPKAWDNSYEICDNLNNDSSLVPIVQTASSDKERSSLPGNTQNDFTLSNTKDLINTTFRGEVLRLENSVDVSLFEKEKQNEIIPFKEINSFSLDDDEALVLKDFCQTKVIDKTSEFIKHIEKQSNILTLDMNNSMSMKSEIDDIREIETSSVRKIGQIITGKVSENIIEDQRELHKEQTNDVLESFNLLEENVYCKTVSISKKPIKKICKRFLTGDQTPKLKVTKICTPVSKAHPIPMSNSGSSVNELSKEPNNMNSLSISLSSFEEMPISLDSFSEMIPTEFKNYNYKQINDEIEQGNIQLFPKTPIIDRVLKEKRNPKERRTFALENNISNLSDEKIKNKFTNLPKTDYFDFDMMFETTKLDGKMKLTDSDTLFQDVGCLDFSRNFERSKENIDINMQMGSPLGNCSKSLLDSELRNKFSGKKIVKCGLLSKTDQYPLKMELLSDKKCSNISATCTGRSNYKNKLIRKTLYYNEELCDSEICQLYSVDNSQRFRNLLSDVEKEIDSNENMQELLDFSNLMDIADGTNIFEKQNKRKTIFFSDFDHQYDICYENNPEDNKLLYFAQNGRGKTTSSKFLKSSSSNDFVPITPRKSLEEFLKYEQICEEIALQIPKSKSAENYNCKSIMNSLKRLSVDITPISSASKKKCADNCTTPMNFTLQTDIPFKMSAVSTEAYSDMVSNINDECKSESIQEMRKNTTSSDRPTKHETFFTEVIETIRPLIFEDNPITISDVSVYFHNQDKNVKKHEVTNINTLHNRSVELPFGNPLENIDQTHLSLVKTISEGSEIETEVNDINKKKSTSDSCNSLQMICSPKRNYCYVDDTENSKSCQAKRGDESYIRSVKAFQLSSLKTPLTLDIKLLRRLRSRPVISDINVLWDRTELDQTIIHHNHDSDDEFICVGSTQQKNIPKVAAIQHYENDILSFMKEVGQINSDCSKCH